MRETRRASTPRPPHWRESVWLADQRDRVAAIETPALILCGDQDTVTPPDLSRELAEAIAGADLHILAGAGHLSNLERPGDFNSAVEEFIARVEGGG